MSSESDELGGRMLLHACCGPCSLEPTRIFAQEGVDFAIHYANSNIFPPEATRRSREKGMYRQNYCGCRFSIAEAEEQRKAAKRKRDEEKRLRHVALLCMAAEGIRTQK